MIWEGRRGRRWGGELSVLSSVRGRSLRGSRAGSGGRAIGRCRVVQVVGRACRLGRSCGHSMGEGHLPHTNIWGRRLVGQNTRRDYFKRGGADLDCLLCDIRGHSRFRDDAGWQGICSRGRGGQELGSGYT